MSSVSHASTVDPSADLLTYLVAFIPAIVSVPSALYGVSLSLPPIPSFIFTVASCCSFLSFFHCSIGVSYMSFVFLLNAVTCQSGDLCIT